MKKYSLLVLLFLTLLPAVTFAQTPFYGRFGGGLGLTVLSTSDDNVRSRATGLSIPIDLAAGVKLNPDLALNLEVILTPIVAGGGKAKSDNTETDLDELNGFTWFLGAGATYFFTDTLYFAGAIGLGQGDGSIEIDSIFPIEVDLESDTGLGLTAQVGTLFPSGAIDLGVAGLFHFMTLPPDVGNGNNVKYVTIGAVFTVVIR